MRALKWKPLLAVLPFVALLVLSVALPSARSSAAMMSTATNFTVTCATTATTIGSSQDGYHAIYCQNNSATSVFLGGSSVTTATAPCISTTAGTCAKPDFSWDVDRTATPSCIVASGTVTLKCIAGK